MHFKLNLPSTLKTYVSGNGEGIFAVVDSVLLKSKIDNDTADVFSAYAANDSVYYPHITCGTKILCEIRKGKRPVAVWAGLENKENANDLRKKTLAKL
jgi:hypothetical protein